MLLHLFGLWCFTENPPAPNITSLPDRDTDRMRWSYHPGCYGHHNFTFNLIWTKTDGPSNSSTSASAVTTDTQYIFSGLLRGEYTVSIQAQSDEDPSIVSDVVSINISLTREGVCVLLFGLSQFI